MEQTVGCDVVDRGSYSVRTGRLLKKGGLVNTNGAGLRKGSMATPADAERGVRTSQQAGGADQGGGAGNGEYVGEVEGSVVVAHGWILGVGGGDVSPTGGYRVGNACQFYGVAVDDRYTAL